MIVGPVDLPVGRPFPPVPVTNHIDGIDGADRVGPIPNL
jgi:hypothetical protein